MADKTGDLQKTLLYHSLKGLHLLRKAPKAAVVRDLCGLQAQFSANPRLSLWLRAEDYKRDTWDEGLIRIWSLRGTVHVIAQEELGLYLSAMDQVGNYREGAWGLTVSEQEEWSDFIIRMIGSGIDDREDLKKACLENGMPPETLKNVFYGWGGLIKEMCWRGQIACATGSEKRFCIPEKPVFMPRDAARMLLMERYFRVFGPATVQDMCAFFGFRMREIQPLIPAVLSGFEKTVIGGSAYYHNEPLCGDPDLPECIFIPGFDQLVMGYKDRSRYLDAKNAKKLTNLAGIVFPAVILRGKVRAKWKKEGGTVTVTPFEKLYRKDEAAVRRFIRHSLPDIEKTVIDMPM